MPETPLLLPSAEHTLEVGIRRATELLKAGRSTDDATRVLMVSGYAAALMQMDAPAFRKS